MTRAKQIKKLQFVLIGAPEAELHALLDAGYTPAQIIRSYLVPVLTSHFVDEFMALPAPQPEWDDENQNHQFKAQSRWQDRAYVINNPEYR